MRNDFLFNFPPQDALVIVPKFRAACKYTIFVCLFSLPQDRHVTMSTFNQDTLFRVVCNTCVQSFHLPLTVKIIKLGAHCVFRCGAGFSPKQALLLN